LASLISCVLLLFVLLWIGPFFEVLPRCILASVIVVAIKGMLVQVTDFGRFRRKSNTDGFVWIVTCLSVVILSIDIGLLVGVCLSIACIFCNGLKCYVCVLGNVENTDLFLDIENFQKAIEIPNVKIIQFSGVINYATKASFRNQLCRKLGINLLKELKFKELSGDKAAKKNFSSNVNFKHLVLDFAPLTNIDASSINLLTDLIKDFNKLDLKVSITSCSTRIYEILVRNEFTFMNILYPSIQDAEIRFIV
jgi:solute carrier family 26 protein